MPENDEFAIGSEIWRWLYINRLNVSLDFALRPGPNSWLRLFDRAITSPTPRLPQVTSTLCIGSCQLSGRRDVERVREFDYGRHLVGRKTGAGRQRSAESPE